MNFLKFLKKGEKSEAPKIETSLSFQDQQQSHQTNQTDINGQNSQNDTSKVQSRNNQKKVEKERDKHLFDDEEHLKDVGNKQLAKIWKPKPLNIEKVFAKNEIIVSKTDTRGNITYGNSLFVRMAGYSQEEMLGQPHSIIRHPDMPKIVFKALWDTVSQKREINAFVINLARGGEYYWVFANVTPSYDKNNNIVGYYSVRRQPNPKAIEIIKPFYHELRKAEAVGGMHESSKVLASLLEQHKMSYEQLIYHLQYNL